MRISWTALFFFGFFLLFGATSALANPLEWRHEVKGNQLEIVFKAHETIRRMEADVKDAAASRVRTHRREALRSGSEWRIRMNAPRTPPEIRVDFRGYIGEQEFEGYYSFPAGPRPELDYELKSSRFENTYNELQLVPDAPIVSAGIIARGEDGRVMLEFTREVEVKAGGTLPLIFETPSAVLSVDVMLTSTGGATRTYRYTPWSFETESRGLTFPTGSAEISAEDERVLQGVYDEIQDAVARVGQYVELQLYIGGYTDTVGSSASNDALSTRRAAAIGKYMRDRGVEVPVFIQGFGERVLAVPTGDNVANVANRRAVFVVRSGAPPRAGNFPGSSWRELR